MGKKEPLFTEGSRKIVFVVTFLKFVKRGG